MQATDVTAKARIRAAAFARFALDGFATTRIKDIADDARVSPALVIHHFESKEGLRTACDEHLLNLIREIKDQALAQGASINLMDSLHLAEGQPHLSRYLARTLSENSVHVEQLIDHLVADAQEYIAVGVESGALKPLALQRDTIVLMTLWTLGALTLHEHAKRLLNVDLLSHDPAEKLRWFQIVTPVLTEGVLESGFTAAVRQDGPAPTASDMTKPDPPSTLEHDRQRGDSHS